MTLVGNVLIWLNGRLGLALRQLTRANRREEIIELFERIPHCRRLVLLALVMSESLGRRGLNSYVAGLLVFLLIKAV